MTTHTYGHKLSENGKRGYPQYNNALCKIHFFKK